MKYLSYFENFENSNHSIKEVLKYYLQCALWVEDYDEEVKDKTIYDFSDNAKEQAKSEIEWFVDSCEYMTDDMFGNTMDEDIGHDLWLSRNGHGAGFFDRDYTEEEEKTFMMLSKILGDVNIEIGDDGKIYLYSSNKYKEFDVKKYKEEEELKNTMKKYNI